MRLKRKEHCCGSFLVGNRKLGYRGIPQRDTLKRSSFGLIGPWIWYDCGIQQNFVETYLLGKYFFKQQKWKPSIPHCIYIYSTFAKNHSTLVTERGPHPTATMSPLAPSQVNDNNNHRRWPTAARCLPEHQANKWMVLTCLILSSVGNLLSCELLRQAGHLRFKM